ncbi:Wzz/FepE/Etk N-terminal domain-containing protein [Colwellia sp. RSH04]|uniref:Wzz/FepE/Etk N-terminal domain-containing protein n=1 Tax=Colwellia sp. RSH04 TaxID=2305464 RepID=UPI000E5735C6|nr:Wzz/FepE/Etk N-terminal domain-containing protein [Colwellia sp. RSH04]RHW74904.1 hypothetical protein D1094_16650 [Colwellia sp. RSH04]
MNSVTPRLLVEWFIKDFFKIVIISVIFAAIAVAYALSIPNVYTSSSKVASNLSESKGMGGALSNLGGIASLAGLSIGGGGLSPEVLKEIVTSGTFLASFIREQKIEPNIMAAIDYDPDSDTYIYDKKIYNDQDKEWVRKYKFPQSLEPSDTELVEKFKENFRVNYDRKTKLISMSYTSLSPSHSQSILSELLLAFNEFMRNKDISDSSLSIKYLNKQLETAKYDEVKIALQQIMEEQLKKLALAKTRKDYAFRYIESPMSADKKSGPKRAIICLAITLIGTFFSVVLWWSIRIFRL